MSGVLPRMTLARGLDDDNAQRPEDALIAQCEGFWVWTAAGKQGVVEEVLSDCQGKPCDLLVCRGFIRLRRLTIPVHRITLIDLEQRMLFADGAGRLALCASARRCPLPGGMNPQAGVRLAEAVQSSSSPTDHGLIKRDIDKSRFVGQPEAPSRAEAGSIRRRAFSLYWRVLVINAAILIVAALLLAVTPFTLNFPIRTRQVLVLTEGVIASVLANGMLLRFGLAPLERLKAAMREADVLQPGQRLPTTSGVAELNDLARTFNSMLSRLEAERRASATRASFAEEEERRRLSRDLHDEIGQRLTAVLLYLKRMSATRDNSFHTDIVEAQTEVRRALDEVRRVLRELRPEALEELGLLSALAELGSGFSAQTGVPVHRSLPSAFPRLAPAEELAVYRIAQEALTNVARYANASTVSLSLSVSSRSLTLTVGDDGPGFDRIVEAGGIRGMRERAIQIGGVLRIGRSRLGGTEVRLVAPLVLAGSDG